MKKVLTKIGTNIYYLKDGVKIIGTHSKISGNVSNISGDVSGIRGDVTGIEGNLNEARITDEERSKGINISDLCK